VTYLKGIIQAVTTRKNLSQDSNSEDREQDLPNTKQGHLLPLAK